MMLNSKLASCVSRMVEVDDNGVVSSYSPRLKGGNVQVMVYVSFVVMTIVLESWFV